MIGKPRPVLENVAVIAVGKNLERNPTGESQSAPVITLLVSPDDGQRLTLASQEGRIQLALRNPLDTKRAEVGSTRASSLYPERSAGGYASEAESAQADVGHCSSVFRLRGRNDSRQQAGRNQVLSQTSGNDPDQSDSYEGPALRRLRGWNSLKISKLIAGAVLLCIATGVGSACGSRRFAESAAGLDPGESSHASIVPIRERGFHAGGTRGGAVTRDGRQVPAH